MKKNVLIFENLHLPFWLLKDSAWAMQMKTLGIVMAFPTLFLSIFVVYRTRHNMTHMLPNLSITFWILANCLWMADEFYGFNMHWICYPPFAIGMMIIAYWLIAYFPRMWREG
jgi:hypothetical protein